MSASEHSNIIQDLLRQAEDSFAKRKLAAAENLLLKARDRVTHDAAGSKASNARVLHDLGVVMTVQGRFKEAETYVRQALAERGGIYGESSAEYAESLGIWAFIEHQYGRFESALSSVRRSLEIQREHWGLFDERIIAPLETAGVAYVEARDLLLAKECLEEAVRLRRSKRPDSRAELAMALGQLALVHHQLGDQEATNRTQDDASAVLAGFDGVLAASARLYLGSVYRALGDVRRAEEVARDVLEHSTLALDASAELIAAASFELGMCFVARGQYAEAVAEFERSLQTGFGSWGPDSLNAAWTLNELGHAESELGKFITAIDHYQSALTALDALVDSSHPLTLTCLSNMGIAQEAVGNYQEAEQYFKRVLQIRRHALSPEHPAIAMSLNNLAALYATVGQLDDAERLYLESLEIKRKHRVKDPVDFALTLDNLGVFYLNRGDYQAPKGYLEEALSIREARLGRSHPTTALSLNNMAELHRALGEYEEALRYYGEALNALRPALPVQSLLYATTLMNLGGTLVELGRYPDAEERAREAMQILQKMLGKHPSVAEAMNALARVYNAIGEPAKAQALAYEALDILVDTLGEEHPRVAKILNNLGVYTVALHDWETALGIYERAAEIYKQRKLEGHLDYVSLLNNLGQLSRVCGNLPAAMKYYHDAMAVLERVAPGHPSCGLVFSSLGFLHLWAGDLHESEVLLEKALRVDGDVFGTSHPVYAQDLMNLAALDVKRLQPSRALDKMTAAIDIEARQLETVLSIGEENRRLAIVRKLRGSLDMLLSLVVASFPHDRETLRLAFEVVQGRKALTCETTLAQRADVLAASNPELAQSLAQLRRVETKIGELTLASALVRSRVDEDNLRGLETERDHLLAQLTTRVRQVLIPVARPKSTLNEISASLPAGSAFVEFVRWDEFDFSATLTNGTSVWKPGRYVAFVLHSGDPEYLEMKDLGPADEIMQLVRSFTVQIARPRAGRSKACELGTRLHALVFAPLRPYIGARERVFIAPDGDLSLLSFAALPVGGDGRCMIDDYLISYVSVGRDLLRFRSPRGEARQRAVVVADPSFDFGSGFWPRLRDAVTGRYDEGAAIGENADERIFRFRRLKATAREGRRVADLFGVQPLLRDEALESTVKSVRSPEILHIATHGVFLPARADEEAAFGLAGLDGALLLRNGNEGNAKVPLVNPLLRSFLALAGANTWYRGGSLPAAAEDAILTADDLTRIDLTATQLVVLSACDTARGDIEIGDGVFGLRRAVITAGARTLVLSLWHVPDETTQQLMEAFYGYLLAGTPCDAALRKAQLEIKRRLDHPLYWAAFICHGDPSSIRPSVAVALTGKRKRARTLEPSAPNQTD